MKLVIKPLEWGLFANEFSLNCSYILIIGAIVGANNLFPRWQIALYALLMGFLIFMLEYPRTYRKDLKSSKRKCQRFFEVFVGCLGVFGRSYFVRFYLYFFSSLPCLFLMPTLFGGTCILTASFIYLKAAFAGFEWQPFPRKDTNSDIVYDELNFDKLNMLKETVC